MSDKIKKYWERFCNEKNISKDTKYEAWSFGNTKEMADKLRRLARASEGSSAPGVTAPLPAVRLRWRRFARPVRRAAGTGARGAGPRRPGRAGSAGGRRHLEHGPPIYLS